MRTNKGRFKKGNVPWIKGRTHSQETRKKLSESSKGQTPWNKGKKVGLVTKGAFKKGMVTWNKGKHGIFSKETLEKMSKARRGKKLSQETRKKMSETHKKISHKGHFKKGHVPWLTGTKGLVKSNKGSFKKGQTPWNKGKKGVQIQSAETLLKRSRSMKGKNRGPMSKEAKRNMSIARRGKKLSPEHKKSITKGLRDSKIVNSSAYKEQQRQFRMHQKFPTKDSKPEKMMQIALTLQKIKFEKHVALVGQPDIFIKPNVCLFIDGDYWHANPKKYDSEKQMVGGKKAKYIWAKDNTINHDLNKNGFHVIRIWQSDIEKDVNKCSEKIITIIKQLVNSEKTVTIR